MTDATNVTQGIILRQTLYGYLKHFPKLEGSISQFGHWKWYNEEYGMPETGQLGTTVPDDSDKDPDSPCKGTCPSTEEPSRFANKV
eukprot:9397491-Lingulodinium_polyedra.AAC.1